MMLSRRQVVRVVGLIGALAGFGAGCFLDHDAGRTTGGLTVAASISSASLAEDCPASAEAGAPRFDGDCAEDGCPSFCQQSQMQLQLAASDDGTEAATIEVIEVRLLDAETGDLLQTLTPREPQAWEGDLYRAWDEQIAPAEELQASYKLSAPDWSLIGGGERWSTYGRRFKLQVVLRVDGVDRTLESAEMSREPEVAT